MLVHQQIQTLCIRTHFTEILGCVGIIEDLFKIMYNGLRFVARRCMISAMHLHKDRNVEVQVVEVEYCQTDLKLSG